MFLQNCCKFGPRLLKYYFSSLFTCDMPKIIEICSQTIIIPFFVVDLIVALMALMRCDLMVVSNLSAFFQAME